MQRKTDKSKHKKHNLIKQLRTITTYSTKTKSNKKCSKVKHNNLNKTSQNFPFNAIQFRKKKQIITEPFETITRKKIISQLNYLQAVEKVFSAIDRSGTGVIRDYNINILNNANVLYFLGSIFRKIKEKKLSITLDHFIMECNKLKKQSSQQDIEHFIKAVSQIGIQGKFSSKQSKNGFERKKTKLLRVSQQMDSLQSRQYSHTQARDQRLNNVRKNYETKTLTLRKNFLDSQFKKQVAYLPLQTHNIKKQQVSPELHKLNLKGLEPNQYNQQRLQSPSFNFLQKQNKMHKQKNKMEVDTQRLDRLTFKYQLYKKE